MGRESICLIVSLQKEVSELKSEVQKLREMLVQSQSNLKVISRQEIRKSMNDILSYMRESWSDSEA